MGDYVKTMVQNGYAVVNVDVRGSGASYGSRIHPWTQEEVKDGAEIVNWMIAQEWCDGNIGTIGVSYSGTTAEFLLHNQHPNVKAAILMYSLFDVYDDIAYPSGIKFRWFIENWGSANSKLDENKLPLKNLFAKILVKGVKPIRSDQKRKTFKKALRSHDENMDVHETASGITFRDDAPENQIIETMDVFSPHTYIEQANASQTPVYTWSGWMDGDYQNASVKRYLNYTHPQNKMILGPWDHGGNFNVSPYSHGRSGFNHIGEILKWFDFHLKGKENGLYQEAPIHYFTMVQDEWKTATEWPPAGTKKRKFYLDMESDLRLTKPIRPKNAYTPCIVDTNAGTGSDTRWLSSIHPAPW
jgi:hypothetical protein